MRDRRQDGPEGLEAHDDVQQVSSKEEVVEVSEYWHGGVPDEIQEVLLKNKLNILSTVPMANVIFNCPHSFRWLNINFI